MKKRILTVSGLFILAAAANAQRAESPKTPAVGEQNRLERGPVQQSTNTSPYYMYKGITDLAEARRAWAADHANIDNRIAAPGNQSTRKTESGSSTLHNPVIGRMEDIKKVQTDKPQAK